LGGALGFDTVVKGYLPCPDEPSPLPGFDTVVTSAKAPDFDTELRNELIFVNHMVKSFSMMRLVLILNATAN